MHVTSLFWLTFTWLYSSILFRRFLTCHLLIFYLPIYSFMSQHPYDSESCWASQHRYGSHFLMGAIRRWFLWGSGNFANHFDVPFSERCRIRYVQPARGDDSAVQGRKNFNSMGAAMVRQNWIDTYGNAFFRMFNATEKPDISNHWLPIDQVSE